jgi:lipid II:glycine glycyltransferase (peptidoglycan interpeptide bridge formation enzyme)
MQLIEITDQTIWDDFVSNSPFGHPLQLWAWGEVKKKNGWTPLRLGVQVGDHLEVAVQVLLWSIPKTKFKLAYVPRGPVIDPLSADMPKLLEAVTQVAKDRGAIQFKMEPAWQGVKLPKGWVKSKDNVLLAETYCIDLNQDEETLQGAIQSKARQYIRKAEREGVSVRRLIGSDELPKVMAVYNDTAQRAGFALHSEGYYRALLEKGSKHNYLLVAEKDAQVVAFVWILAAGSTAFELYGGMTREGAKLHGNYVLKAHAMQMMKAEGFMIYDFNGRLNDGVSHFKSLWGASETDWIGSYNLPLKSLHYKAWQVVWPIGKKLSKIGGKK